jgi:hypothetical protein
VGKNRIPSIAYYVSAHGYGHGVRACDIVRALNRYYPEVQIHIVSGLAADFLCNRICCDTNLLRPLAFDVGMIQKDSIRVDIPSTLARLQQLHACSEELIRGEMAFIRKEMIDLVVVDIPSIPVEAAERCGIPSVAIGNFGWDWIYESFSRQDAGWTPIVEKIRAAYSKTDLLMRLPFSEEMRAFPHKVDLPLVASAGNCRRDEIAGLYHCDPDRKWVLLSFTTLEWNGRALDRMESLDAYEFFTVHPLQWNRRNVHTVFRETFAFSDVVASVDAVVSKPGFGILSDCVVNGKPLIYADRSDFAEFDILEAAIKKYLKYVHVPQRSLYEAELGPSLEKIWTQPEAPDRVAHGGELIAAQHLAQQAKGRC